MNACVQQLNLRWAWRRAAGLLAAALLLAPPAWGATAPASIPAPLPPPTTPREFFNTGTALLLQHKLREAEALLESAAGSQVDALQPRSIYNLGHVRFDQGLDELKKGPAAGPTAARGRAAEAMAGDAAKAADDALAGDDIQKMVAAYLQGRGARRELKAATKAVKEALESEGVVLHKWQRASGDFKSADELHPPDADARQNADTVDRCLARLVDTLKQMQQLAMAMGDKKNDLGEKMKKLKGRIPAADMPPGAAGDDDDDEDQPNGPKPGDKEGPSKNGQESQMLSQEQAGWVLEGFKLGDRRLPMGEKDTAEPQTRNGKTW